MKKEILIFVIILILIPISGCLEMTNHEPKVNIIFLEETMVLMNNQSENMTGREYKEQLLLNKTYILDITQLNLTTIDIEIIHNNSTFYNERFGANFTFNPEINITLKVIPPEDVDIIYSPSNPERVTGPNYIINNGSDVTKLEMNITLNEIPESKKINENEYDDILIQETNRNGIGEWKFNLEFHVDMHSHDPSGGSDPGYFFFGWNLTMIANHYHVEKEDNM